MTVGGQGAADFRIRGQVTALGTNSVEHRQAHPTPPTERAEQIQHRRADWAVGHRFVEVAAVQARPPHPQQRVLVQDQVHLLQLVQQPRWCRRHPRGRREPAGRTAPTLSR